MSGVAVLADVATSATTQLNFPYTVKPPANATTFTIAGTVNDVAWTIQKRCGDTIGWVTIASGTVTAGNATLQVIDAPKAELQVQVTPSAATAGHIYVDAADQNTQGASRA